MAKKKTPSKPKPRRSARLCAIGFVDLGHGAAIRASEISSFHPAILDWCRSTDRYHIPGKSAVSRTVIVDKHGNKLPCARSCQMLSRLIFDANDQYKEPRQSQQQ